MLIKSGHGGLDSDLNPKVAQSGRTPGCRATLCGLPWSGLTLEEFGGPRHQRIDHIQS